MGGLLRQTPQRQKEPVRSQRQCSAKLHRFARPLTRVCVADWVTRWWACLCPSGVIASLGALGFCVVLLVFAFMLVAFQCPGTSSFSGIHASPHRLRGFASLVTVWYSILMIFCLLARFDGIPESIVAEMWPGIGSSLNAIGGTVSLMPGFYCWHCSMGCGLRSPIRWRQRGCLAMVLH